VNGGGWGWTWLAIKRGKAEFGIIYEIFVSVDWMMRLSSRAGASK
jgi:hypothetical protein